MQHNRAYVGFNGWGCRNRLLPWETTHSHAARATTYGLVLKKMKKMKKEKKISHQVSKQGATGVSFLEKRTFLQKCGTSEGETHHT